MTELAYDHIELVDFLNILGKLTKGVCIIVYNLFINFYCTVINVLRQPYKESDGFFKCKYNIFTRFFYFFKIKLHR